MGIPIPNSKLGMWLFLGTEIMFFTAFIGTYIVLYFGSPGWPTVPATNRSGSSKMKSRRVIEAMLPNDGSRRVTVPMSTTRRVTA